MRRRFNESDLWEQARAGELLQVVLSRHEVHPERGLPSGTVSLMIEYRQHDGTRMALVHQYLLPSGAIGGSGRPDPKSCLIGDVLYRLRRKRASQPQGHEQ